MSSRKQSVAALVAGFCMSAVSVQALADVWVLEPSVTLDQRIDDNYFLTVGGDGSLSATRGVAQLGLSRQAQDYAIEGLARVDALLTTSTDVGDEDLDSNQIFIIDARRLTPRSRYGARLNYTQDTPSRDIAADISDSESLAEDTGILETQSLLSNVAREEWTFEPSFEYDISRRLAFDVEAEFTLVEHGEASDQDVIFQRYLDTFERNEDGSFNGTLLPFDEVTIDDVGVFSPDGELRDFNESEIDFGLQYKYSPITTLTSTLGYSRFVSDADPGFSVPFEQLIPDSDVPEIRRRPLRETVSTTTTFVLGYRRFLSPILQFGLEGGAYINTTDTSDTLRPEDVPEEERAGLDDGKSDTNGWLAGISLDYDAGTTRYTVRFDVDVLPSSAGSQVETNELIGQMRKILSPRLDFSLRGRAFEPDRLGVRANDRFARRFISFEPRIQWKYTRNWTLSAAYRYRRQKARSEPISAESNAVLFAIKYVPPSKVRDAAQASGL